MSSDFFDISGLARYLHLDLSKIERLLKKGRIPGKRVGGQWRFNKTEINQWLENEIGVAGTDELEKMEESLGRQISTSGQDENVFTTLLAADNIVKPLNARTKKSVIREICHQASLRGLLWDETKMAELISQREEMHSTALDNGMALLHPRRPQPNLIGDPFIIMGVTPQGIPFGGPRGQLTDIFLLLASCEDSGHLQVLARLSRVIQVPEVMAQIRSVEDPAEIWQVLREAEESLS